MRLFLIRHGESVDNAAGVYAGSRDSGLTAHGALQTRRLASSLAQSCAITHILSSPLQRAAKTAGAVCDAQNQVHGATGLTVTLVPELREKDFGSLEGVSFRHGKPNCPDAETAQCVRERVCRFWDEHMLPLLHDEAGTKTDTKCAVVAHGILLRALASLLCENLSTNTAFPPGPERNGLAADSPNSEFLSWSNTGYLEVYMSKRPSAPSGSASSHCDVRLTLWHLRIERVNCVSHLDNLKKTRGGIGSAPFDDSQRTIERFFSSEPKPRTNGS
ncbi:histidine phosphatase superfamily (branch 1) domain-containing protein [Hirsutella rhossiliensis]|uniref:Histidine phosphatase superfamily (Branch 1) domain-containing protein n=1 Tax=Hirsutella rhossiliensis TaxID=111463 RepID=A0A9P8SLE3_9HYPO|nr:histidine phosphatase superfamily (branch 1) domain-containing protein [Hirsutella rhossiliensis]KAH0966169.1 histidine phosphatase superfamily (branch 1) domain-containing protein [Hirsutella rhossiliensis]